MPKQTVRATMKEKANEEDHVKDGGTRLKKT